MGLQSLYVDVANNMYLSLGGTNAMEGNGNNEEHSQDLKF